MDIYTVKDVCEKYKITRQTFSSWIKQGLRVIKIKRMIRIREEDLEKFINSKGGNKTVKKFWWGKAKIEKS